MRWKIYILMMIACCYGAQTYAQAKKLVKQGNKLYEAKKYKEAAAAYQEALKKDPTNTPGMFNLGNSLYQQKQFEAARKVMDATAKITKDKSAKGAVNYNAGNTYMEEKKWEDAINSYKQALRANPQDAEAKYNLSYAQSMLKKDQNGGGGKNNKDNKDQKKDQNKQQDQDKKNDDKNKQNDQQQNKEQDKQDQNKQEEKPQPQQSKLSEKQAEQLLNALQQEEKKLQDKMQKAKGIPAKVDKDW